MELTAKAFQELPDHTALLQALDKGIDDMEHGRELPLADALKKITELRNEWRHANL